MTHNSNDAVRLEKGIQALQELECEQRYGLGASCKDIMDNIVKSLTACVVGKPGRVGHGVLDYRIDLGRKVEVFGREFVDHRVNLNHCGIDAMSNQGTRCGANAEAAVTRSAATLTKTRQLGVTYITSAFASLSGTF